MLIIQRIKVTWTKKSRGMPGAFKRNAIPHVLELPESHNNKAIDAVLFIHEAHADEDNNFQLNHKTEILNDMKRYWSFTLHQEEDIIRILFTYNYHEHGQPKRQADKTSIFKLEPNDIAQFLINGRYTSYSGQFYMQYVVNFANVERYSLRLFLDNQPSYIEDKLDHLF